MPRISPWFLGILLAPLWLGVPSLYAEESSSEVTPALSAASGASEGTTPKGTTPQGAAKGAIPQEAATEGATPGVDSAVVAAQQEVGDPFATDLNIAGPAKTAAAPASSAAQPAAPPVKVELQGIGFGSKDAYAIFGGEVFFTGDEKNGIKLVEVRRREVDIIVNGGPMTCVLFPGQELKDAKEREKRKRAVGVPSVDLKPEGLPSLPRREQLPS